MPSAPTPAITDTQHRLLTDYIQRHNDAGTYSMNPIHLARVLAGDRPAGALTPLHDIDVPDEYDDVDEYVPELAEQMGLYHRTIGEYFDVYVSFSSRRLDLLPTVKVMNDAFHKRLGVVLGYPPSAVDRFLEESVSVTWMDMVRAEIFDPEDVAFTVFVPYAYHGSLSKYRELIDVGKDIKQRMHHRARMWDMDNLNEYVDDVYDDAIASYAGDDGGSFNPGTSVPLDEQITPSDLELAD